MNQEHIEDIHQSATSYVKKHYLIYLVLFGIGSVGITVYIYFYAIFDIISLALPVLFFGMGYVYLWNIAHKKLQPLFMRQFGQSIGFSYEPIGVVPDINTGLFNKGSSRNIRDVLSGIYNGKQIRIYNFSFTVPSGRSSQTFTYTVFEVTINNTLPNIILYSRDKSFSFQGFNKPKDKEYFTLEGDFHKYFDLYIDREHAVIAYEIFSPDKMVTLIDEAKDFNFEFNKNKIYIYTARNIQTKKEMQTFFHFSDYLITTFGRSLEVAGS